MDVLLNGEARAIDASECANLAELVAVAERVETPDGPSVVVAIEVDGQEVAPEEMARLEQHPIEGISRISIQRRPTLAVAHSVLAQGADYTGQIVGAIEIAVGHYRSGRSDLGHGVLADITDSLHVLTGITVSVSGFVAEADDLARLQGEIAPWLEALFEAQQSEDPTAIADVLEYEVSPRIEQWGQVMRSIVGSAVEQVPGSSPEAGVSN